MGEGFDTVRCIVCGQMNRCPRDVQKSGGFNCGKCGKPLVSVVSGKRKTPRGSFGPILAVLFVIGAIYATIANNQSHDRSSSPAAPQAKQPPTPVPNQKTSSVPIAAIPQPISQGPIPDVPLANMPPVQSLEIPSSALAKNRSPAETPNANEPKRRPPGVLDMEAPAPGCLEKLPTYESLASVCEVLDKPTCNKHSQCNWWYQPNNPTSHPAYCSPKIGLYVSSAFELDRPGLGQFTIDLIEPVYPSAESAVANANRHAASGRLDRAISAYSSLLVSNPDFPQVLDRRAALYERKGLKSRALADYCKILVVTSNRDRRLAARERIAALSGKAPNRLSSPEQPLSSLSEKHLNIVPTPRTGEIQPRHRRKAIAPLSVETEAGTNYFIKLVNDANVRDQIWIFIKGGEMYSTKVPFGNYNLRAATGGEWHGREDLFGPTTRFFRLRSKPGSGATEVETLRFFKEGNRIMGMTLKFKPVQDGNMEQEAMSRSEFDAN